MERRDFGTRREFRASADPYENSHGSRFSTLDAPSGRSSTGILVLAVMFVVLLLGSIFYIGSSGDTEIDRTASAPVETDTMPTGSVTPNAPPADIDKSVIMVPAEPQEPAPAPAAPAN